MDISTSFSDCLSRNQTKRLEQFVFDISKINEFLWEAYRINSHITGLTTYLRSIRSSYLSLQPHRPRNKRLSLLESKSSLPPADGAQHLTDIQKTRIDNETRQLLTTISEAVRQLSETAKASSDLDSSFAQQRRRKKGGVLGRWAAGGGVQTKSAEEVEEEVRFDTIRSHRDGVIWYLQRRLERAGEMQRSMVEKRVQREIEKSKSMLYKVRGESMGLSDQLSARGAKSFQDQGGHGGSTMTGAGLEQDKHDQRPKAMGSMMRLEQGHIDAREQNEEVMQSMLSPEQVQMFEMEQQDMLKHYSDNLHKIRTAESSLMEISSLQSELAHNLEVQSESISQLVADSESTTENIDSANKQLKKANERKSTAQMIFYATLGFCSFITVWDLIF